MTCWWCWRVVNQWRRPSSAFKDIKNHSSPLYTVIPYCLLLFDYKPYFCECLCIWISGRKVEEIEMLILSTVQWWTIGFTPGTGGGGSGFFLVGPYLFGRDPNKTRQKDGTIWGKNVNKIPVKTFWFTN